MKEDLRFQISLVALLCSCVHTGQKKKRLWNNFKNCPDKYLKFYQNKNLTILFKKQELIRVFEVLGKAPNTIYLSTLYR